MAEPGEPLSERELDVLRCLAKGSSNKDIAADLTISENTVKVHLRNIYTKLVVSSRTEATTAAIQQGYIVLPGQEDTADLSGVPLVEDQSSANGGSAGTLEIRAPGAEQRMDRADVVSSGHGNRLLATRRIGLAIGAVLLLLLAVMFGRQFLAPGLEPATEEPFAETALGDTRWLVSRPLPKARANMAVASFGL
ncbi:MAG: response regulator transcription factor, partial [Candidatus Promineifilaceae bacterium]